MMSLLITKKMFGAKRVGVDAYEAVTADPRFVYRFWLRRPYYMVVFLEGGDEALDPKIYVDRGNGYDERTAHQLEYSGPSIYVFNITRPRRVRAIRIDPCSSERHFRYRAAFAWTEVDLKRLLFEDQTAASGRMAKIFEIPIDGQHEKRRKRDRRKWIARHYASAVQMAERAAPDIRQLCNAPFISFVVPTYNTPTKYLDDLLASFLAQPKGSAELILSDDGSSAEETRAWLAGKNGESDLTIIRSDINRGIAAATNAGIQAVRTEWIGLVDHDDALTAHAVDLIAEALRENPRCQFLYTDELVTNEKLEPIDYFLKPAYDKVLLSGVNYINHLSCYKRERLLAIGCMREGYEGSQDYDLLLRYLRDLPEEQIRHLPYPAYRWRRSEGSYSSQFLKRSTLNARKALGEHHGCPSKSITVEEALTPTLHRVRFDKLIDRWPAVSVIIPNRDSLPLISRIVSDLLTKTYYPGLEIVVVDNGTTDLAVLDFYTRMAEENQRFHYDIEPGPFNFSRQVNRGIGLASSDFVLLLNNDVEVVEPHWLREMVSCFQYPDTGVVGARLLYPSQQVQHAGVVIGLGGLAGHWFSGVSPTFGGPMGRLHVRQSFTAVTGACMLVSRACLNAVGDFDEQELAVAYNDIDFCLRTIAKGFRIVWTPFATLIHHESASRGSDETPANRTRLRHEQDVLRRRHRTDVFEDRAFNPWYTRDRSEPFPVLLEYLPKAR